jgi:uncharacterized protein YutE (UPF0331/DUF86 family)
VRSRYDDEFPLPDREAELALHRIVSRTVTRADYQTLAGKPDYPRKQPETPEPYRSLPKQDALDSLERQFAVERMLELSIQTVIDASRLLVSLEDWRALRDERDALLILADRAVIPNELVDRPLKAKGFRNVLVHDYVAIDPDLLYAHLRDDADDLWDFARHLALDPRHPDGVSA